MTFRIDKSRTKLDAKKATEIMQKAMLDGMRDGLELIVTDAIDRTPIDSGTLRRSGTVTVGGLPDPDATYTAAGGGKAQGRSMLKAHNRPVGNEEAVYASFNTPYAGAIHEGFRKDRKTGKVYRLKPREGQTKYLESAWKDNNAKVNALAAARVRKALAAARKGVE